MTPENGKAPGGSETTGGAGSLACAVTIRVRPESEPRGVELRIDHQGFFIRIDHDQETSVAATNRWFGRQLYKAISRLVESTEVLLRTEGLGPFIIGNDPQPGKVQP